MATANNGVYLKNYKDNIQLVGSKCQHIILSSKMILHLYVNWKQGIWVVMVTKYMPGFKPIIVQLVPDFNPFAPKLPVITCADPCPFYRLLRRQF